MRRLTAGAPPRAVDKTSPQALARVLLEIAYPARLGWASVAVQVARVARNAQRAGLRPAALADVDGQAAIALLGEIDSPEVFGDPTTQPLDVEWLLVVKLARDQFGKLDRQRHARNRRRWTP